MNEAQAYVLRQIVAGKPVSEGQELVVERLRRLGFVSGSMQRLKATPVGEEALRRHKDDPTMWLSEESTRMARDYAAATGEGAQTVLNTIVHHFLTDQVISARRLIRVGALDATERTRAVAAIRLPGETT